MDQVDACLGPIAALYPHLQDRLSKRIFWARLHADVEPSVEHMLHLFGLTGLICEAEAREQMRWREAFERLLGEGKQVFLYGTGTCGKFIGAQICAEQGDFTGFCDQHAALLPGGMLGKPVISPEELLRRADKTYVALASMDHSLEIERYLLEHSFPGDHILPYFSARGRSLRQLTQREYFEFPELYRGGAFVDGGSFHGETSARFAKWSGGNYTRIYAFEPDRENIPHSEAALRHIPRAELIHAALGDKTGTASFVESGTDSSHVVWSAPIHNYRDFKEIMRPGGIYEGAVRLKEEGIVEHICASLHAPPEEMIEIIESGAFEGVTVSYSMLNAARMQPVLDAALRRGVGVVVMNPLGGGVIAQNRDYFSIACGEKDGGNTIHAALRFAMAHPAVNRGRERCQK